MVTHPLPFRYPYCCSRIHQVAMETGLCSLVQLPDVCAWIVTLSCLCVALEFLFRLILELHLHLLPLLLLDWISRWSRPSLRADQFCAPLSCRLNTDRWHGGLLEGGVRWIGLWREKGLLVRYSSTFTIVISWKRYQDNNNLKVRWSNCIELLLDWFN